MRAFARARVVAYPRQLPLQFDTRDMRKAIVQSFNPLSGRYVTLRFALDERRSMKQIL